MKTGISLATPFLSDVGHEMAELRDLVGDIGQRSFDERVRRRQLPEEFDSELWCILHETELTLLTTTPELDAGPIELAILLHGLARCAAAVPISETDLLAAWLAGEGGIELPGGPITVGIGTADVSGGRIRGTAIGVPWARAAAAIMLACRTGDGLRVAAVSPSEIEIDDGHNLAGEPRDVVGFDLPACMFCEVAESIGDELTWRGAWARCVQIIGALETAAELTVAYTRDRIQFGHALSEFQSVQHSLAGMAGEIARSRATVTLAVTAAADFGFADRQTRFAIAASKSVLSQTVSRVTTVAHQLHGALGVTFEHPLRLFTMRAKSWIEEFGSAGHYARHLGRSVLVTDSPWDVVIDGAVGEH